MIKLSKVLSGAWHTGSDLQVAVGKTAAAKTKREQGAAPDRELQGIWAGKAHGCEEGGGRDMALCRPDSICREGSQDPQMSCDHNISCKTEYVVSMSYFLTDKENRHSAGNLNACHVFKGTATRTRFQISHKHLDAQNNLWQVHLNHLSFVFTENQFYFAVCARNWGFLLNHDSPLKKEVSVTLAFTLAPGATRMLTGLGGAVLHGGWSANISNPIRCTGSPTGQQNIPDPTLESLLKNLKFGPSSVA